ncbi:hypothetical protein ACFYR1_52385 [Streptomyces canus]
MKYPILPLIQLSGGQQRRLSARAVMEAGQVIKKGPCLSGL